VFVLANQYLTTRRMFFSIVFSIFPREILLYPGLKTAVSVITGRNGRRDAAKRNATI
jgi:hypothetical protein